MHIRKRTTCRVCGSSSLTPVIDLGPQYLQGSFVKPGKEMPSHRKLIVHWYAVIPRLMKMLAGYCKWSIVFLPKFCMQLIGTEVVQCYHA